MNKINILLNTFLVQGRSKDSPQIILSLTTQPSPRPGGPPPRAYGRLLALAEITSPEPDLKSTVQSFITQVFRQYQEHAAVNSSTALEKALEWANHEGRETLGRSDRDWLNMLVGCIKEDQIQFAVAGKIGAQIFYQEPTGFQAIDLVKNYVEENNADVLFSHLITGSIQPDNYLLFNTPNVYDFLTTDRLQKIVAGQDPTDSTSHLEKILSAIENTLAYGGILISLPSILPLKKEDNNRMRLASESSIRKLLNKEKETAGILSPNFWHTLSKLFNNKKSAEKTDTAKKNQPAITQAKQEEIKTIRKITTIYNRLNLWRVKIKNGWTIFAGTLSAIFRWGLMLIFKFTRQADSDYLHEQYKTANKPELTESHQWLLATPDDANYLNGLKLRGRSVVSIFPRAGGLFKSGFLALNWKRRVLLSAFVILISILIISLGASRYYSNKKIFEENYNTLVNEIKASMDEAESSMIYKNEDNALKLLKSIRTKLSTFPQNSSNRKRMFDNLTAGAEGLAKELQRLSAVVPTTEADLTGQNSNPTGFYLLDNSFTLFTAGSSTLTVYNRKDKTLTPTETKISGFKLATELKDNTILILDASNRLWQFNPTNNALETKEIIWPSGELQIKALDVYNNRLYATDASTQQILKFSPTNTGWGKSVNWLTTTGLNLGDINDMAIDSAIYMAKNNGEVWKMENNQKQNWNLDNLEPKLTTATKIYTQNGSDNLFILDAKSQRVVIWNKKDNKLIAQYTSPDFHDLRDMAVNEKDKKIYLLDGVKVVSIRY